MRDYKITGLAPVNVTDDHYQPRMYFPSEGFQGSGQGLEHLGRTAKKFVTWYPKDP